MKNILLFLSIILIVSCRDEDDDINDDPFAQKSIVEAANKFVYDIMDTFYYWADEIPDIDYTTQTNTIEYFNSLRSPLDRFSYISMQADELRSTMSGELVDNGLSVTPMLISEGRDIGYVVNYVFPNSSADEAGVKRGDIIYQVNMTKLNLDNYLIAFTENGMTYSALRYDKTTGQSVKIKYTLYTKSYKATPIFKTAIFDGNIAYMHYTNFYQGYDDDLENVFWQFKKEGVTSLILDLRYNIGGYNVVMQKLCSLIAPEVNVMNQDTLIYEKYNDAPSNFLRFDNCILFDNTIHNNLNINNLVVLVGSSTYSASEMLIIALQPYMDVFTIGAATGGKNQSMVLFTPDLFVDENNNNIYPSEINNWIVAPIVSVGYNSQNYTFDSSTGIIPNVQINEYDYPQSEWTEIGDPNDKLIATAISYLTLKEYYVTNKSATVGRKLLPYPRKSGIRILDIQTNK